MFVIKKQFGSPWNLSCRVAGFFATRFASNGAEALAKVPVIVTVPEDDIPRFNALDKVTEQNVDFINQIRPSLKKSFNLAAYVNVSDTLQQLLKLNVDLSRLDKYVDLASYIVRADFKSDIEPHILFLLKNRIDISDVGSVLNRNPFLLTEHLDDLQTRINYFIFRKFSPTDIASFFIRAANIFSYDTQTIDSRLGCLMKEYELSPNELRQVIKAYPRIIALNQMQIKKCTFMFKEEMGFEANEIKSIILRHPILWRKFWKSSGHNDMIRAFDYVHQQMSIPHDLILKNPPIFNRRVKLIRGRHLYLKALDRAQYDPREPLYVPLSAFYELDDATFCLRYAKTSVNDFNTFLKTI